jgi:hypothetical protein
MIAVPLVHRPAMKPSAMLRRPRRVALVAAAAATMLAAGVAGAADKSKSPPAKKSADAILTPEQLRDCLDKQTRRDKATDAAMKTKADVAAAKAAIDRSGNALSEEATTLDRTSEDAVNAYNAKVDERNKQIEAYETKVAGYNKEAESVQALNDAYAQTCSNRRYDDRDLSDIQRKK